MDDGDDIRYVSYEEMLSADRPSLSDEEMLEGLPPFLVESARKRLANEDRLRRAMARSRRVRQLADPKARRRTRPLQPGDEIGASKTLAVRLPRWAEEQIRRQFAELEVTPSEGLRQILEEWCVERLFPCLEHRDRAFVRFAAVRGGPEILDWLRSGRPPLDGAIQEQVLDYVELFRGRIDALLAARRAQPVLDDVLFVEAEALEGDLAGR